MDKLLPSLPRSSLGLPLGVSVSPLVLEGHRHIGVDPAPLQPDLSVTHSISQDTTSEYGHALGCCSEDFHIAYRDTQFSLGHSVSLT